MNKNQKRILVAVAAFVIGMLLYPPCYTAIGSNRRFSGYSWIFARPSYCETVDTVLLVVQWLGVLIVGGIAFTVLKNK